MSCSLSVILLIAGVCSFSMPTMAVVLVHHTRLAGMCLARITRQLLTCCSGLALSRTISFKAVLLAGFPEPRRVCASYYPRA